MTKIQIECQIVLKNSGKEITKGEIESIEQNLFRLEKIANTSDKFRTHINNIGSLYQMIVGTNDENCSKADLICEIKQLEGIANILNIECCINILNVKQ